MSVTFKELGFWKFDDSDKPLVKINDILYTLDGWNGYKYQFSRKVLDIDTKKVDPTLYCITPEYIELNNDINEMKIVSYNVSLY